MFGMKNKEPVREAPKEAPLVSNYDREWLVYSCARWRVYFEQFLCDIELEDYSQNRLNELIEKCASSADESLRLEQARWGRSVMDEKGDLR